MQRKSSGSNHLAVAYINVVTWGDRQGRFLCRRGSAEPNHHFRRRVTSLPACRPDDADLAPDVRALIDRSLPSERILIRPPTAKISTSRRVEYQSPNLATSANKDVVEAFRGPGVAYRRSTRRLHPTPLRHTPPTLINDAATSLSPSLRSITFGDTCIK